MNPLIWWTDTHGKIAPLGHVLRSYYPEMWVRFHSLPESKRYPESEQDLIEVVSRAAAVASTLFVKGDALNIYKSRFHFDDSELVANQEIAGAITGQGSVLLLANPGVLPVEDDDAFITWAREDIWPPSFFEKLIRQVANEDEMHVCLVSPKSGNMLCPYDGGMDVFTASTAVRRTLNSFNGWRSNRSDGL